MFNHGVLVNYIFLLLDLSVVHQKHGCVTSSGCGLLSLALSFPHPALPLGTVVLTLSGRKGCILTICTFHFCTSPWGPRHQSQTLTCQSPLNSKLVPLCCNWGTGPPHLSTGGNFLKKPRLEPTLDMWGICPTLWPRAQNCM